jgi:hypothetical protein
LSSSESGSKRLEWRLPGVGVKKSSEVFSMSVKDIPAWVFSGSKVYFLENIVFLWGDRVARTKNDEGKKAGMHKCLPVCA